MLRVGFQKKTGALLFPNGGQLAPPHAPQASLLLPPPQSSLLPHALHFLLRSLDQDIMPGVKALLVLGFSESLGHECPSLRSSAQSVCQGNICTQQCFLRQGSGSRWQERAGEGAKPREPLAEAQGQRLSSLGSRTRRFGVPPKSLASVLFLSDQLMLHRTLYLAN